MSYTQSPPQRYIHIDDYSPVGFDNGPDDAAFANARADLAASGYHTLIIGQKQYWLQNGFNLNAYTDAYGNMYPPLSNVLITSDSAVGLDAGVPGYFNGMPATIILSPGYADPGSDVYTGGSEPCRTTGSIFLGSSCGITNLRIMSLAAYQFALSVANGQATSVSANALVFGAGASMANAVGIANGMLGVSAGGGTAIQIDADNCYLDNLVLLGFRNGITCVPSPGATARSPRIGWIKSDCANTFRVDSSEDSGIIDGPIAMVNSLTESVGHAYGTITGTPTLLNGGTSLSYSYTGADNIGATMPGLPLTIGLNTSVMGSPTVPIFNAANVGNLNPAGVPSNRYSAIASDFNTTTTTTAGGKVTFTVTGSIFLPNIPPETFFQPSGSTSAVIVGSVLNGTLTLPPTYTGAVGPNQLLSGVGGVAGDLVTLAPGTTIGNSLSSNTWTVTVPAYAEQQVVTIPGTNTALVDGSISNVVSSMTTTSILSVDSSVGVSLAIGQLVYGPGIPGGTTISSLGTMGSNVATLSPAIPSPVALEFIYATASGTTTAFAASCSISGTNLTTTGTLAMGDLLFGVGVLPNSFVANAPPPYTVNVFQAVGTGPGTNGTLGSPVALIAAPVQLGAGAIFSGSFDHKTLTVTASTGGTLAAGQVLIGAGVPYGTAIETGSGSSWTINQPIFGPIDTPITVIATSGNAIYGSISAGVLTVLAASNSATLSGGDFLIGDNVLPGSFIASAPSSGEVCGNYMVGVAQLVGAAGAEVPITVLNVTEFQGSITDGLLTVAPSGTLVVGGTAPTLLHIFPYSVLTSASSTFTAGSATNVIYVLANAYSNSSFSTVTVLVSILPIQPANSSSAVFTGTIGTDFSSSSTLNGSAVVGTLAIGQQVTGPGLDQVATVLAAGGGTATLNESAQVLSTTTFIAAAPLASLFSGSVSNVGTTLVVASSVDSGALAIGQALAGEGIPPAIFSGSSAKSPIFISSLGSLTSPIGPGTVLITGTGAATATGTIAGFASPQTFVGTLTGLSETTLQTLIVATNPTIALDTGAPVYLTGPGILPETSIDVTNMTYQGPQFVLEAPGVTFGNYPAVVGSQTAPVPLTATSDATAANASTVMGYIKDTTLVCSIDGALTLEAGQFITGPGILPGTRITSQIAANTYSLAVLQDVATGSMTTIAGSLSGAAGAFASGVIAGTALTVTAVKGALTSSTGTQALIGQGVALGTYISGGTVSPFSLSVAQFVNGGTSATILTVVPSSAIALVAASAATPAPPGGGTPGVPQLICTASQNTLSIAGSQYVACSGVALGTQASGTLSSGVIPLMYNQNAGTGTFTVLEPTPSSSFTPAIINFSGVNSRPGRVVEINASNQWAVRDVSGFGADTIIRAVESIGINIYGLAIDSTADPDMFSTAIDIQGGGGGVNVNGGSCINHFTYLNNNSSPQARGSVTSVRLLGLRAAVTSGGTLINHLGAYFNATACDLNTGAIVIGGAASAASFSGCNFGPPLVEGLNNPPPAFVYQTGAPLAVFDGACVNTPVDTLAQNVSPGSLLTVGYSAVLGGQLGADLGRIGYMVNSSATTFSELGDRQAGRMLLGGSTVGSATSTLTADGNAINTGASNTLVMPAGHELTYVTASMVAISGADFAVWSGIAFAFENGVGLDFISSSTGTYGPNYSNPTTTGLTLTLRTGGANTHLVASVTSSNTGAYNYLLVLDCIDIN